MMFQGVEVTKVSTNSTRDFIRVSIYSRHLIQKKDIYEVERMLKQQLFARSHIQVTVREQYDLSEQYTPENLMNEYYDQFSAGTGSEERCRAEHAPERQL